MASITALDLITLAATECNICGQNGDLSAPDANLALQHLNYFINSGNADRAVIYTIRIDTVTTVSHQQHYTIGIDPTGSATADFNIERPVSITQANLLLQNSPTTVRLGMQLLNDMEWSDIAVQQIYSQPRKLYNDGGFAPNGFSTLYFWPIPDQVYQVELYSWQSNGQIANLTDPINYPPGYADYWMYGLACRLFTPFGRPVNPDTRQQFRDAQARLSSLNAGSPILGTDPALGGFQYGTMAKPWLTGPFFP